MCWNYRDLGFAVGAPIKRSLGAALAVAVDQWNRLERGPDAPATNGMDSGVALLAQIAGMLARIAQADGHVAEVEKVHMRSVLAEANTALVRPLKAGDVDAIMAASFTAPHDGAQLVRIARQSQELRLLLMRFAWRIAASDDLIHPEEERSLEHLATVLGSTNQERLLCSFLYQRGRPRFEDRRAAAALLGVDLGAPLDQVTRAFRTVADQIDAERDAARNELERETANERLRACNDALNVLIGEDRQGPLYGAAADSDSLLLASPGTRVSCFDCLSPARLPEQSPGNDVRCPACHSLLLFEFDAASALNHFRRRAPARTR